MDTIDEYLAAQSEPQRSTLQVLRTDIHQTVPEATECMAYGVPGFRVGGKLLVSFGGAKQHCAIYPGAHPVEALKDELAAYSTSKGTVRFAIDQPLPTTLVRKLVQCSLAQVQARAAKKRNKESA